MQSRNLPSKITNMKALYKEGDNCPLGQITIVLPVKDGEETVDYVYELNTDPEQRYTTEELVGLIEDAQDGGR